MGDCFVTTPFIILLTNSFVLDNNRVFESLEKL